MFEMQRLLAAITGFAAATLQPAAGAQGELAGMLMMRAYHLDRGDTQRRKVLVPDSAHGTNPATAAMCGFHTVSIPSDANGDIDLAKLQAELDDTVVGLMLTNPNTLGLFEKQLREVTDAVHNVGGLSLRGRRKPERHPRQGQAGRHGLRRGPHQFAQDVFHAHGYRRGPEPARSSSTRAGTLPCHRRSSSSVKTAPSRWTSIALNLSAV